jgi:hypothetical protein
MILQFSGLVCLIGGTAIAVLAAESDHDNEENKKGNFQFRYQ